MGNKESSEALIGHEDLITRERLMLKRSAVGFVVLFAIFALVSLFGVRPRIESGLETSVPAPLDRIFEQSGIPVRVDDEGKSFDRLELTFRGGGREGTLAGRVRSPAVRDSMEKVLAGSLSTSAPVDSPLAMVKSVVLAVDLSPPGLEPFLAVDERTGSFPASFDPVEFARESPNTNPLELLPSSGAANATGVVRICGLLPDEAVRNEILETIRGARPGAQIEERLVVDYEATAAGWTSAGISERLEADFREFQDFEAFISRKLVSLAGASRNPSMGAKCKEQWIALASTGGNLVRARTNFVELAPLASPLVRLSYGDRKWKFEGAAVPGDIDFLATYAGELESLGMKVDNAVRLASDTSPSGLGRETLPWLKAVAEDAHAATFVFEGDSPSISAQAKDEASRKRLVQALEAGGNNVAPELDVTLPPESGIAFALLGARVHCSGVVPDTQTKLRFERLIAGYPSSESSIRIDPHALPFSWPEEVDKSVRLFLRHAWNGKVELTGKRYALEGTVLYEGEKRELDRAFAGLRDDQGFAVEGEFEIGEPEIAAGLRSLLRAATTYFEAGKAALDARQSSAISKAADELVNYPELRIVVAGHSDSSGNPEKNLALSRERAEAVGKVLQRAGIEPGRIALKVFGDTRAAADESTEEGRRLNRRVEIKVK